LASLLREWIRRNKRSPTDEGLRGTRGKYLTITVPAASAMEAAAAIESTALEAAAARAARQERSR
jgi:hypothetical protein